MKMYDLTVRTEGGTIIIDQMEGDDPTEWASILLSAEQAPILATWLRRLAKQLENGEAPAA
ncbi:hypothetical protein QZN01_20915 [Burkholderia cenocepacia]|uniref:hypothetical protein n=1 Tax=Burkholderia cenocepacia TaxID=95486 RepID=UPI00264BEC15|nr:hypothetical protein [Burkholderia cenocepacia]MDN7825117.1 hypothetical protein [Burkholderia cenocepacia]